MTDSTHVTDSIDTPAAIAPTESHTTPVPPSSDPTVETSTSHIEPTTNTTTASTSVPDAAAEVPERTETSNASAEPTPAPPAAPADAEPQSGSVPVPAPIAESAPAPAPAASDPTPPATSESVPSAVVSSGTALPPPKPRAKAKGKSKARRARPRRRVAGADGSDDEDRSDASGGSASDVSDESASASEEDTDEDEEDEDAVEDVLSPTSPVAPGGKKGVVPPVFADADSTTPAGWADMADDKLEEVRFEEIGSARGGRGGAAAASRGRGRGRGGAGAVAGGPGRERRELTEEELKRLEARREKKKEKAKTKRAEAKEAKKKEREEKSSAKEAITKSGDGAAVVEASRTTSAPASGSAPREATKAKAKGKGRKADASTSADPSVTSLVASTSALTVDDQAVGSTDAPDTTPRRGTGPSRGRGNSREVYAQRIANDPKYTPRVGGFWTHDQRHYESGQVGEGYAGLRGMSDYWRGRGGMRGGFRGGPPGASGGFRGRGRGFGFGPGPSQFSRNAGRGVELAQEEDGQEEDNRLEMDKLEAELERREASRRQKAQDELLAQPMAASSSASASASAPATTPAPVADTEVPVRAQPVSERKWGHEGFEAVQASEQFFAARGGFRGRGRGRGAFIARRHFIPPPVRRPDLPTPASTPDRTPAVPTNVPSGSAVSTSAAPTSMLAEDTATQPDAESLLSGTADAVTVRLPGSDRAISQPLAPAPPVEAAPNGSAVLYATPAPAQVPTDAGAVTAAAEQATSSTAIPASSFPRHVISPIPPMYTGGSVASPYPTVAGSENGSISSAGHGHGHFIPSQQPTYLPPGIGVTPTGEYYNLANGAPVDFRPAVPIQQSNPSQRPFYPQSRSFASQPQGFYPGQTYSPEPYIHSHSQRGSFSSPAMPSPVSGGFYPNQHSSAGINGGPMGFPDGPRSASPFAKPYAPGPGQLGYFVPAQSRKVSIRAPQAGGEKDDSASVSVSTSPSKAEGAGVNGRADFAQGMQAATAGQQPGSGPYHGQAYNPYAGAGEVNGYDGMDMRVQGQMMGWGDGTGMGAGSLGAMNGGMQGGQGYGWQGYAAEGNGYGYDEGYGY